VLRSLLIAYWNLRVILPADLFPLTFPIKISYDLLLSITRFSHNSTHARVTSRPVHAAALQSWCFSML